MNKGQKDKHIGQLPLDKLDQALEDEIRKTGEPPGMPPLSAIKTEVAKYGLIDVDAEHMYDIWLLNGFTLKGGKKVQNWKAAVRVWHRNGYFPSQKKAARPGSFTNHWQPPTLEEVKAYASRKRWASGFARHCYNTWVGNNWRHYGEPIASDEQWKALMESMDYKP